MSQRVLIIGAGRIGRTIENLLLSNGQDVHINLWDKDPQRVLDQLPLASLVPAADVIFLCTPSWTVQDLLVEIQPLVLPEALIVIMAKGMVAPKGMTMSEVADTVLPKRQSCIVLGGPMLAEALEHGHRGIGVVGGGTEKTVGELRDLFQRTPLSITGPAPRSDVALCGCLKNVYAFLVGMMSGLSWSPAERQNGFQKIRQEFFSVGTALGIHHAVLHGPAGVGDFEETATSPASHNHHCGLDSATHNAIVCTCEGTVSATFIAKHLNKINDFPLLKFLVAAIAGQRPVADLDFLRSEKS